MKVLGLDSATTGCSAAVWVDGRIAARRAAAMTRGQAEVLVPMVGDVLAEAGISFHDLDRIAVTVGPGAFTGVRIALAAARGFALGTGAGIVGITTFDAVVGGLLAEERAGRMILVAVDSRRAEPFVQLFETTGRALGEPTMPDPRSVRDRLPPGALLVAGDGADTLLDALTGRPDTFFASGSGIPDAAVVAALGAEREPGAPPQPAYLRPPDVTPPRGNR